MSGISAAAMRCVSTGAPKSLSMVMFRSGLPVIPALQGLSCRVILHGPDFPAILGGTVRMNKKVKFSGKNARPGSDFNSGAYYRRYYFNPATRVTSAAEMADRAALILAALRHARIPVRRILGAGCGVGLLRRPFARLAPRISYTGLEDSDYLC